jgi:hypothetical protein
MSCYVDPLFKTIEKPSWPFKRACHLVCDSHAELLSLAGRLRLRMDWIQNEGGIFEHFDLTDNMRNIAVKRLGVKAINHREMANVWERKRGAISSGKGRR